ncbi:hypothetical protein [Longispora albida]|uniref:hypothetical protein n=1 Tax=Longispora albida TaxID=203523 RepID=UPI0003827A2A|nr:hypothetical protein [Longispora albida]
MGVAELTTLSWDGYAARWATLHGEDPRLVPQPNRFWLRLSYALARPLARFGVTAGAVTVFALVASLIAPGLAARGGGWPVLSAVAVVLTVAAEGVSRALSVLTDRITRLGYVYAALCERIAEAAWLATLWVLGAPGGLLVACGGLTLLHEYLRSRTAETGSVLPPGQTLGDRAGRAAVAAGGLLVCGLSGLLSDTLAKGAATLAGAAWLLLAVLGFASLLTAVRRTLS